MINSMKINKFFKITIDKKKIIYYDRCKVFCFTLFLYINPLERNDRIYEKSGLFKSSGLL